MAKRLQEIQKTQARTIGLMNRDYLTVKEVFKNTHTLRLTKYGKNMLSKQYDAYEFESPKLSVNNLINLLRKMKFPYYVDKDVIVLFTEQDAFLAKLAGSQGWLDGK
jgi:elongation factor P--beta-lysine ligase